MKLIIHTKNKNQYNIYGAKVPDWFGGKGIDKDQNLNDYIIYHFNMKYPIITFGIFSLAVNEIESWEIVPDDED